MYGSGTVAQTADLQRLQQALDKARAKVVAANRVLVTAEDRERSLRAVSARLHAKIDRVALLSDRLAAERQAIQFDVRLDPARAAVESAQTAVQEAQSALKDAQQSAKAPSFTPAVGSLMGAASYDGQWAFPVGGGPEVVSAAHTHHDYPAVDIAAPAGSPVYAISNAVVLNAWHEADARCGIGMTIRTTDGQTWTYCHLAVLDPSVVDGVSLAVGTEIGLVGSTGHATGPHLHLQLQPATGWPQYQPWFQNFAGKAFRWQDAPTELELPGDPPAARVFTVIPETRDGIVAFTRSRG